VWLISTGYDLLLHYMSRTHAGELGGHSKKRHASDDVEM
jgi:hypothetical protein